MISRIEEHSYNINTQVRKLFRSNQIINELKQALEHNERWKKLMSCLPKDLQTDISGSDYPRKYTHTQIETVAQEGNSQRTASEILIDEWSTSGRTMPTIQDLLRFLLKSNLYIPAALLTHVLKNESLLVRPASGPGALVDISSIDDHNIANIVENGAYPQNLDDVPSSNLLNPNIDAHQSFVSRIKEMPQPLNTMASAEIPNLDSLMALNPASNPVSAISTINTEPSSSELTESSFNMPHFQLSDDLQEPANNSVHPEDESSYNNIPVGLGLSDVQFD